MNGKIICMFSIFQKKIFLVDLIEGISDFHNHILPGIDDGSGSVNESINMVEAFREIGVKQVIASPHVIGEYYPNTPETIRAAYEKLTNELDSGFVKSYSAEYMLDQHFLSILSNKEVIPIIGNHVLVEMSYFQPPINMNELLFKLQSNSYIPILAHPERYGYLQTKDLEKYKELKTRGCKFQLNMLSLVGHYGAGIQKIAESLLENKMIDFISSDAHKIEHIEKIKTIKLSTKVAKNLEPVILGNTYLFN